MKVIDKLLLAEMRSPGPCSWCGKPCTRREPAHLWARGHGGGGRLDIRVNLISLGSTLAYCCDCHTRHHDGHRPLHCDLLLLVAARENVMQNAIEAVVWMMRRLPKAPTERQVAQEIASLPGSAMALAMKTLSEVPEEQQTWGRHRKVRRLVRSKAKMVGWISF